MKDSSFTKIFKNRLFLSAVLVLLTGAMSGCAANENEAPVQQQQTQSVQTIVVEGTSAQMPVTSLYDESLTTLLYEQCIPAVVQIDCDIKLDADITGPFQFKIPDQKDQGSGFFIDDQGHILTNNHLVENAKSLTVTLYDGTELEAELLGTDRYNDLALIKVNKDKLNKIVYLPLGDSDKVKPGQMAIALGSPYGLQGSITVGVVSGLGRSISGSTERSMTEMIQTDAAINPGNSGGPLLNSRGEVIGINAAIEAYANSVGFAIPVNTAKHKLTALMKGGQLKAAWLGVEVRSINVELATLLELPVTKGSYVLAVSPGGPAEKAGLKAGGRDNLNQPGKGGDIITGIDGVTVNRNEDIISYLTMKQPGDKVTLSILRGKEQMNVQIELGEWPETTLKTSGVQKEPDAKGFDLGPFDFRWKIN